MILDTGWYKAVVRLLSKNYTRCDISKGLRSTRIESGLDLRETRRADLLCDRWALPSDKRV